MFSMCGLHVFIIERERPIFGARGFWCCVNAQCCPARTTRTHTVCQDELQFFKCNKEAQEEEEGFLINTNRRQSFDCCHVGPFLQTREREISSGCWTMIDKKEQKISWTMIHASRQQQQFCCLEC